MLEDLYIKPYLLSLMALRPSALFGVVMAQPFYAGLLHDWADRTVDTHTEILELGCGPGLLSHTLAARPGCSVLGLDRAPSMIQAARRRPGAAQFAVGDATETGLSDGRFDCVVGASILNVVADPVALVREARRLSRGRVSFLVPSRRMTAVTAARFAERQRLGAWSRAVLSMWSTHARKLDEGELEVIFHTAGFAAPRVDHYLDGLVVGVSADR